MNAFQLRVLLIEDSPTDVLLLQDALEQDRLSPFVITHVDRLSEAFRRLREAEFDIIVADLGLPDSSGFMTFERLQAEAPDLPVVIFSGNFDETVAVQAVQAGAQDYLVKSPGGFEIASRTLRYAVERHKTQLALRQSEARFSKAFAHSPVGTVLLRLPDLRVVDINAAALKIWGYAREEVLNQSTSQLGMILDPAQRGEWQSQLVQQTHLYNVETQLHRKDGIKRDVILSVETVEINDQPHLLALLLDNTERKLAEAELRLHSEIMTNMSEGITLVRISDGLIVYTNLRFDEMFGYQPGELLGQSIAVVNAPAEPGQPDIRLAIQSGVQASGTWSGEVHNIKKNGERFWCFASVRLFDHPTYGQVGLAVQANITPMKAAEQQLAESEERHRLVSSITSDYVYSAYRTPDGRTQLEWLSGAFEQITGYTVEEANRLPNGYLSLMFPEDMEATLKSLPDPKNPVTVTTEYRIRRKDGEIRWQSDTARRFETDPLGIVRRIGAVQDITDRKVAEEKLRQSEEQYRRLSEELEVRVQQRTAEVQDLFDNAPSGYHSLDTQGRFVTINQTELNWLGYPRSEIIGRPFSDFVTPYGAAIFQENFPKFIESGQLTNLEMELKRKDGSVLPVLVNATAIRDAQGHYLMSRSTVSDITERKKAEVAILLSRDELRVAYAALEKAARAKDEFLATMSHELRTPLNGILGISEILLEGLRGPLNEHQQRLVHAIDNSGRHLLSLINDILDLSKIEAGRLELHPEPILVEDVCQSSLAFIREMAVSKGIALQYIPDVQARLILADARHLKQILVNLLGNAVKFTPAPGQVILTVAAHPAEGRLEFGIRDTGIGIASQNLQRLFLPFTQVDSSLTRQHEGTGLGLALVKRLTELHGGQVSVISEVGHGSTFTVSLPWQPDSQIPEAATESNTVNITATLPAETRVSPATILLAEDTETNIMMMGDYLEELGYHMVYARDGNEALQQAEATQPDLILMDIQMPHLDGLEATRRLRTDPRFATTPIIALTALAMPGDRERCLEAGTTDYVSKPVRLKQLAKLIRELIE